LGSTFREYRRYSPDFNFRIILKVSLSQWLYSDPAATRVTTDLSPRRADPYSDEAVLAIPDIALLDGIRLGLCRAKKMPGGYISCVMKTSGETQASSQFEWH
jgi:hypothetical protein